MTNLPPFFPGLIEFIAWLGIGTGMLVNAIKTHRAELGIGKVIDMSKRAAQASEQAATELQPNHGSSSKDKLNQIVEAIARLEISLGHQEELAKSLGHQVGEINDNATTTHRMIAHQLENLSTRLTTLEQADYTAECSET